MQNIYIVAGATLYVSNNFTFPYYIQNILGDGTLYINSGVTLSINNAIYFYIPSIAGSGSITGNGYFYAQRNISISASVSIYTFYNVNGATVTISGSSFFPSVFSNTGVLALSNNYILNSTVVNGPGTCQINSGYTLTVSSNYGLGFTTLTGSGTLSINSGITLNTALSNHYVSGITIAGAGVFQVASGTTLNQTGSITLTIANIQINGTWANAGYGITIPSGYTVNVSSSGTVTTASTPGTLTVNGKCYWIGTGVTNINSTTDSAMSFVLNFSGSGIFVGSAKGQGTSTVAISLSSTAIAPSNPDGSATSKGGYPYFSFSSQNISGNTVGKYSVGIFDEINPYYKLFMLVYIGTANTNYTISGYFGHTVADLSTYDMDVYNSMTSAGTITLTGKCYV
jgi:hypothetical protein